MPYEPAASRYRRLYALLLRLYPKPYRERFAEGMGQTFHDLCRERMGDGKGLFTFALWMFGDTFIGMISIRISFLFSFLLMQSKHILRPALITALVLMIPAVAMRLTSEVDWGADDFIVMGVLIFSTCLAYELITRRSSSAAYRLAVGIGVLTALLLIWVNLAVGFIGDDNPANLLYLLVPWVGIIGATIARLKPQGMSIAMFAMAFAQMLIPVIAVLFWRDDFSPGVLRVFVLSAFFAGAWVVSGLLFRQSTQA